MLEEDNKRFYLSIFRKAGENRSKRCTTKVWQDEFHPEAITSEKWFRQKMEYMHNNPVRKGFVEKPEDWKYSSARNWLCEDDSIIKVKRDYIGF